MLPIYSSFNRYVLRYKKPSSLSETLAIMEVIVFKMK